MRLERSPTKSPMTYSSISSLHCKTQSHRIRIRHLTPSRVPLSRLSHADVSRTFRWLVIIARLSRKVCWPRPLEMTHTLSYWCLNSQACYVEKGNATRNNELNSLVNVVFETLGDVKARDALYAIIKECPNEAFLWRIAIGLPSGGSERLKTQAAAFVTL
jgi:hypothetical protein